MNRALGYVEKRELIYIAGSSACEKGGQWPEALSLLREMEAVKLELDVISYSAASSACETRPHGERGGLCREE